MSKLVKVKITREELLKHATRVDEHGRTWIRSGTLPDFVELDAEIVEEGKPHGVCGPACPCRHRPTKEENYWKSVIMSIFYDGEKIGEWQVNLTNCVKGFEFEPRMEVVDSRPSSRTLNSVIQFIRDRK